MYLFWSGVPKEVWERDEHDQALGSRGCIRVENARAFISRYVFCMTSCPSREFTPDV